MRSQRFALGFAGMVAACLFSFSAHANPDGMVGRSGKVPSETCLLCHGTNPSPIAATVEVTGPDSLQAGAVGTYVFTVRGGPAVTAGMNVAASSGTLQAPGADLRIESGELTHRSPKAFERGEARFEFQFTAPAAGGTATLYYSGNSTNGDGTFNGDSVKSGTKQITITAPPSNPGDGGDGEEEDKGCSATGGAPMALFLALVATRLRRRA